MRYICLLAALAAGIPAIATSPIGFRLVAGTVSDAAGLPVANARITVRCNRSSQVETAMTDSSGRYSIDGLAPGALTISVAAPGFEITRTDVRLADGFSGARVSFHLVNAPAGSCPRQTCVSVQPIRPSEVVRLAGAGARRKLAPASLFEPSTNSPADFTIQTAVIAPAPPRFGFNFSPSSYSTNNIYNDGGGMDPYDARLSFNATDAGAANTFIVNDCAGGGCVGTDFFQSIATGYFTGANARVYHFDANAGAWGLIDSGTVTGYTANSASTDPADHTITLNSSGAASQAGDAIWLARDAVAAIPDYTLLDPRLQAYGFYNTMWTFENGPAIDYMTGHPVNGNNLAPFSYVADAPPGDNYGAPGTAKPLSLKISDSTAEFAGVNQYIFGGDTGPNQTESLQPAHTYQVSLWLKQAGVASGSVTFYISSTQTFVSHTFTGVTGTWQQFTWQFPGFLQPPITQPAPQIHIDYQAPGTLWIDQVQISDVKQPAFSIDTRVIGAWKAYAPQTMRIWTNFDNAGGFYSYWSLDSWLAPDSEDRVDPNIGNIFETHTNHAHLPRSLNTAKNVGADPWLIVNMSLTEAEWGNLIDYLTAPAGLGYAKKRPANHPGPYTADFDRIYLEFGNEEWGTQYTAVNRHYGEWVHYMLSQAIAGKAYFDAGKVKFIVNGFTLVPSIGSAAAAAAPEASIVDIFSYNSGDTTLTGDAYYQSDLFSLIRFDATLGAPLKNLLDAQVAQQKQDASNGVKYDLAVYEGGPGADVPAHQGDTSLAAAVGNLDTFLYASSQGVQQQNFFLFSYGNGPYTSHSYLYDGFRPHPSWEALQMRNQYCHGDMTAVTTNAVPVSQDANQFPLISVYAFHEVNASGVDQADIVVLSRDLNNQTPVTLRLPSAPTGKATIYTLTGDPRSNNDTVLNVPIGRIAMSHVPRNLQFIMPPGSVYLLQVPLTSWPSP